MGLFLTHYPDQCTLGKGTPGPKVCFSMSLPRATQSVGDQATGDDFRHVSGLHSAQSFVEGRPELLRPALRESVACHPSHPLLSVTPLKGEFLMPLPINVSLVCVLATQNCPA